MGGHVDKADRFIAPTILDYGSDLGRFKACEAMQDENFGPVVPAVRFQDVEQVRLRGRASHITCELDPPLDPNPHPNP